MHMEKGCVIGENVNIGKNVTLGYNVIIEDGVTIGDNSYIDSNSIIRSEVSLGENSFIGANCIIGEYGMYFCIEKKKKCDYPLQIGRDAIIRSGSIIYEGSTIGEGFQTGHHVTIRKKAKIGNHVSVGTFSDIQGNCEIGNYVRMHSNVHIGQFSVIDDFVWIYPYVVLTNDPTPPSDHLVGVHIRPFAIVATGSIVMPGVDIGQDSLVAAGCTVTKDVAPYAVVMGNPGKVRADVRDIKSKFTGKPVYPWRKNFHQYMPWSEGEYLTWYNSLDLDEKIKYKIDNLISDERE